MKKRALAIVLAVCLLSSMAIGCSPKKEAPNSSSSNESKQTESESPDAGNESVTIKGWGAAVFDDTTGIKSYNDQSIWAEIEKKTGVKVEWTTVTSANNNAQTQFGLIMAAGDLPDFFVDISPMLLEEFGRKGALLSLNEQISNNMPNLSKLMEADPDLLGSITSADKNIYFTPRAHADVGTRCWPGYMIREDWLEQVNLPKPETTEDMYQALKAFKEKIPTASKPYSGDIKPFIWAFGVGSRGSGNNIDDTFIDTDGKIKFGPTDPRFKDAIVYLNKLVNEGLIDAEWNGITGDQISTNVVTELTGASFGSFAGGLGKYNKLFAKDGKKEPFVAVAPLIGPTGFRGTQGMHTAIDPSYGAGITSTSKNPDAVAKFLDYTYGTEGRDLLYFGTEGDTCETVDGKLVYTKKVIESDLGILSYLNNYVANVSCYPAYFSLEHYRATLSVEGQKGNEETTKFASNMKVPAIRFTDDEITKVNSLLRDINSYVDENVAGFVNGKKAFTEWDSFITGFDKLNLPELMDIYTVAYNRFLEATK